MNKFMKALTVLALSVLTTIGVAAVPATSASASGSAPTTVSFLDVPSSHPFATEIAWMAEKGITTGYDVPGGKEFRPQGTVGRDAMAAFLYRFAGSPAFSPPGASPFLDVPNSHQFYKEISWLASTGVSNGWDAGGGKRWFRPSMPITRDAMAAFLYRFAGSPAFTPPNTEQFTDVHIGQSFFKEISWLASTGITSGWDIGYGKRQFRPSLSITREAMAAFLYRYAAREAAGGAGVLSDVISVASGDMAGYALRRDGTVWVWGSVSEDGNGTPDPDVPGQVAGLSGVTAVSGGSFTGYALRDDGTVWAWGTGSRGELGNGSSTGSAVPVKVEGLSEVTAVSGGDMAGYALRGDGTVWAWGDNAFGQLGNGSTGGPLALPPAPVVGLSGISAIAGSNSIFALRRDGTVWAWGYGEWGQLGNGTTDQFAAFPVRVSGLSGVTAIDGGYGNGYALRNDGTVWAWGLGGAGQLGNGSLTDSAIPVRVSGLSGVTAIDGGYGNGYALRNDGTAWAWGFGGAGQLGNGSLADSAIPVRVSGLSGVTAIAGGSGNGYALRNDGTVWAWGTNNLGELGNRAITDNASAVPVRVGG